VRRHVYVEQFHRHGGCAERSDEMASGRRGKGHDATRSLWIVMDEWSYDRGM
jgi:hypothetical protein